MKIYKSGNLRNVALLGHGSAGKTSLAEAMLYDSGAVNRLGRVDEGTSVSDWDDEERRRKMSINATLIPCEWRDHKLNVIDTPGYMDFVGEVVGSARVVDAAVVLVDSVGGVEVGTEQVWDYADEQNLPRLAFVNKMERENANFQRVVEEIASRFHLPAVPIQLPIGSQADFQGVVDLLTQKAYVGEKGSEAPIPAGMADAVEEARMVLLEAAAEGEDALMEKYFESETLTEEEILRGLKARIRRGDLVAVLCGSAAMNIGVQGVMQAIVDLLPSPVAAGPYPARNLATNENTELEGDAAGALAALVFKTVADPYVGKLSYFRVYSGTVESDSRVFNSRVREEERLGQIYAMRGKEQLPVDRVPAGDIAAVARLSETQTGDTLCDRGMPLELAPAEYPDPLYSVAVTPKTKADAAKISPTLTRLAEQDPTLRWRQDISTRETILSGMGDTHINVAIRRMEETFSLGLDTAVPRVPYMETITRSSSAQYRHKKQTGGAGQFAEVHMRVEPRERDSGFEFAWEVVGMNVSKTFGPSIEKGIKSVLEQGVIAGYPVVDVMAAVYDGKEHPVDSKDIAFQIAGREVFKLAFKAAGPVLLEPIYKYTISVPEEYMGDVLSDLNTRRAQVLGMDQANGRSIVTALVPLAEMQRYVSDLRSITQGRGLFSMEFASYQNVPGHLADQIVAASQREAEEK
ncbi:MAG: elongation factor G [Anaerolineaceae bacterium]|nr:elongation factor G [Anaerolineaceae bacterium]